MTTIDRLPMVTPANDMPGPKQGEWTYDTYAALPDDGKRYEVVNGVLYMSPSPSVAHQKVVGRFFYYLLSHVELTNRGTVLGAPIDVVLSPKDVFQPDVLVILNAGLEKIKELKVIGAPDLVVEVESPGTATQDRNKKYQVYAQAGVPEYWIANPGTRTVEVLVLDGSEYRSLGVFRGQSTLPSRVVPGLPVHVEQFFAALK